MWEKLRLYIFSIFRIFFIILLFSKLNQLSFDVVLVYKYNNKMKNSQVSPGKLYEQYRKIFCAYHKTEFLTNFCVDSTKQILYSESCLMPLCPSCIVDHTQQHYRQPSKPLYMNLHEALYDVKQSCLTNIQQFQNFAHQLVKIQQPQRQMSEFKKKLVQEVHHQLIQHKQNIYAHIERLFMQYEHDVYNILVADYEEQGLYRENDINEFQYKVQDTINDLYDKIGLIKGDQCLAALIMYYGEEREKIGQVKSDCEKFIFRHDSSKIETSLDQNAVKKQFENLFENVVAIQKLNSKYEPIQSKTPQKSNNMNNSRLSQSRRSRIFNQSGSKYISPPKSNVNMEASTRKERGRYQSALR